MQVPLQNSRQLNVRLADRLSGLAVVLLSLGLAGCQSHKTVAPLTGGYLEVTHPPSAFSGQTGQPRVSFEQRGSGDLTVMIWPALYGVGEVIQGDLAIFVGDKAYVESGSKVTHPRLFAVKPPELPLDITDEVLWRWSKASGKDFAKTLDKFSLVTPAEKDGRLELQLDFWSDDKDWPSQSELQLGWNQVTEIMGAVKKKGVVDKDLRWHTPYVRENF